MLAGLQTFLIWGFPITCNNLLFELDKRKFLSSETVQSPLLTNKTAVVDRKVHISHLGISKYDEKKEMHRWCQTHVEWGDESVTSLELRRVQYAKDGRGEFDYRPCARYYSHTLIQQFI